MDPKPSFSGMLLAPSYSGSGALRLPSHREALPAVDDRLVQPETREQLVRGRRVVAMPSNPPHGDRHFKLDYVIGAHVKDGYVGSTDLLTRSAARSDFATHTCVRRDGVDPRTDTRYLEEVAFEVVNEQSLRDVTEQAEDLTARGVRRVMAIFVKKGEVCEWSAKGGGWKKLDPESTFVDRTLALPVPVRALLDAAEADNAVARALLAKNNPVLDELKIRSEQKGKEAGERQGKEAGKEEGLRQGIEVACELLGVDLTPERHARITALDASGLEALLAGLRAERRWPSLDLP